VRTSQHLNLNYTTRTKAYPKTRQASRLVEAYRENLEMNTAQGLLSDLTQNLQAEQTIRLSISWIVEEGSTE
jgi:hypothetical protein